MTNAKKGIIIGVIALVIGFWVFTGRSPKEEPKVEGIAASGDVVAPSEDAPKGEEPIEPAKNGVKITPEEYRYTKQNKEKKTDNPEDEGTLTETAVTSTEAVITAANKQPNSNKSGGSLTTSSSSNASNTSSNNSSSGSSGTASSGSSSTTATSQGGSNSSSTTTTGGSSASNSGSSSSSSGNSSSSDSNSGAANNSSRSSNSAPSQPASHAHNYVPGVANFSTGDRIDACSCGATINTRGTWVVDIPAREAEYYEEPIYETGSRYWIPRSDNPSVILWEGYSWDGVTADTCWAMITTLICSEEGKRLSAEGKLYASNYMKGGASRIIGYETKLSRPAQEEVGRWEW